MRPACAGGRDAARRRVGARAPREGPRGARTACRIRRSDAGGAHLHEFGLFARRRETLLLEELLELLDLELVVLSRGLHRCCDAPALLSEARCARPAGLAPPGTRVPSPTLSARCGGDPRDLPVGLACRDAGSPPPAGTDRSASRGTQQTRAPHPHKTIPALL